MEWRIALGRLQLANPVLAAAGTVGYGLEFARALALHRLGALVTKTLTLQPRPGHSPPRLVETPAGLLNAVGLSNVGLRAFLREKLPALRRLRVPVIVSVLGEAVDELAAMLRELDRAEGVAGIELNLSCPNLIEEARGAGGEPRTGDRASEAGGRRPRLIAHDAEATFQMVRAARQATGRPLIAKLSPDVTDLVPIAQAAERGGAEALTIGNTFVGMSLDPATRRSRLGTATGGLSGPAIRPLAVYRVWYTAASVGLPIIAAGGIVRADDAIEFFLAGASAVAIGTANFADPLAPLRVLAGLERYLSRHRIRSVDELRRSLTP